VTEPRRPHTLALTRDAGPAATVSTAHRSALREPGFRRYLVGQSTSQLGNQVWLVALSWTAVQLGSAATAGVLLTLSSIPRLVLILLGGVLADRFDIRRLMIGSDLVRTLLTLGAAAIALVSPGIALLAVLAVSFGTVDAVFLPSAGAMQPRLLDPAQYSSGAVATNMIARLALSVGAPLGGVLVATGGLSLALLIDGITFAVSVATLATVRPRALAQSAGAPRPQYRTDFVAGVRFVVRHPVLGPLTVVTLLTNVGFVGPMNIGLAELSRTQGWGASGIGVMLTGFGLGSAAGALAMTRFKVWHHAGAWIVFFGVIQAAALLCTSLAPSVVVAALATAVVGVCSGPMAVLSAVLSQTGTPDKFRGRVSSMTTLVTLGLVPLASAGTGFAIAALGVTGAYALCAGVEAAAVLALFAPSFRSAKLIR
jgi:MFS family permease